MPIQVQQSEFEGVLYYEFSGNIIADHLRQLADVEEPIFESLGAEECISILADWTDLETISPHLFPKLQQMRLFSDERVCRAVIVGANAYLRALAISLSVISQHHPFTFSDSYEAGLKALGIAPDGR